MPVTVKTPGPRTEKSVHPHGEDVAVDDAGNLMVTAREGRGERVIAVYAASAWTSAEVD